MEPCARWRTFLIADRGVVVFVGCQHYHGIARLSLNMFCPPEADVGETLVSPTEGEGVLVSQG